MARSSTSFKPGQSGNPDGKQKGLANKLTNDQRAIFDAAISPEVRVLLVEATVARALIGDKDSATYMKLVFEYVFSKPKIGHQVALLDLNEVLTTEVCDAAWIEIIKEARERDARSKTPILGIIDAEVVETVRGNGRQKGNGQARNGRKKTANSRRKKNSKARKG